jgi:hypothetical protein
LRFLYAHALGDKHSLSMGLSLEDITYEMDFNAKIVACNDLDPECSTVDAEYVSYRDTLDVLAHELYLEDTWSVTGKTAFTFGFNYSNDDYLKDGRIEPRVRFDYRINDQWSTYASPGQYSQYRQAHTDAHSVGEDRGRAGVLAEYSGVARGFSSRARAVPKWSLRRSGRQPVAIPKLDRGEGLSRSDAGGGGRASGIGLSAVRTIGRRSGPVGRLTATVAVDDTGRLPLTLLLRRPARLGGGDDW